LILLLEEVMEEKVKEYGNDNDETMVKIGKGVLHIAETFKPGSYDQIKRLGQAATGKADKYGNLINYQMN
jgi:hypothetical protein